jgi:hypothetical protein
MSQRAWRRECKPFGVLCRLSLEVVLGVTLVAACGERGPVGPGGASPEEVRRRLVEYQGRRFSHRQFFVGVASGPSLDQATGVAFRDITRQLTWLPSGSQDMLRGMYRVEQQAADSSGTLHVLAALERESAAATLRKLSREADSQATAELAKCRHGFAAGELEQAKVCLEGANQRVARARDLLTAARAAVGDEDRRSTLDAEAAAAHLAQKLALAQTRRRSALLHVVREMDGAADGDLDGEFSALLSDRGLRRVSAEISTAAVQRALAGSPGAVLQAAKHAGAGFAIVGRVQARFRSEDTGQYFSMAQGAIQVIETIGGRILAEVSCSDVKGGHISRQQANERAVRAAVTELKSRLRAALEGMPR